MASSTSLGSKNLVNRTILCIVDDPSRLLLYRSMLELRGHSVLVAATADEILEVNKGTVIDCAILDHERDSLSLAQKISRSHPSSPILLVSDRAEIPEKLSSLMEMFITRDEAIQDISSCVQELLHRRGCS